MPPKTALFIDAEEPAARNGLRPKAYRASKRSLKRGRHSYVKAREFRDRRASPPIPGDTIARKENPILKGVEYSVETLQSDGETSVQITEAALRPYADQYPLYVAYARQRSEDAINATACLRQQEKDLQDRLHSKQTRAEAARRDFCSKAQAVSAAMEDALRNEKRQYRKVAARLANLNRRASRMVALGMGERPYNAQSPMEAAVIQPTHIEALAGKVRLALGVAAALPPNWTMALKIIMGIALGIALAIDQKFLNKTQFLRLKREALFPTLLFSSVGVAILFSLSIGVERLWSYAGRRAALEAKGGYVSWSALKHTLVPLLLTLFLVAVEAALFRNAKIASPSVRDPGNIAHWLSALPLMFAVTLDAATRGWQYGHGESVRHLLLWTQEEERRQEVARRLTTPAAQEALAFVSRAEAARVRLGEITAKIERIAKPYETLLGFLEMAMHTPEALTHDEELILDGLRLDAIVANRRSQSYIQQLANAIEGLPHKRVKTTTLSRRDLAGMPPPPRVSWRTRLQRFFARFQKKPASA